MPTDDQIEQIAIKAACGNNGGTWAAHYTEEQKAFWRMFALSLVDMVVPEGYVIVPKEPTEVMVGVGLASARGRGWTAAIQAAYRAMIEARPR